MEMPVYDPYHTRETELVEYRVEMIVGESFPTAYLSVSIKQRGAVLLAS